MTTPTASETPSRRVTGKKVIAPSTGLSSSATGEECQKALCVLFDPYYPRQFKSEDDGHTPTLKLDHYFSEWDPQPAINLAKLVAHSTPGSFDEFLSLSTGKFREYHIKFNSTKDVATAINSLAASLGNDKDGVSFLDKVAAVQSKTRGASLA